MSKFGFALSAIAAGLALVASAVVAGIPDADSKIVGCYKNRSGTVRIIDSATQSCTGSETQISWYKNGLGGFNREAPKAVISSNLDSSQGAGTGNIVTVGSDGLGVIAYYSGGTWVPESDEIGPVGGHWVGVGSLKIAHCADLSCTSATITTLADDGDLTSGIGLAVGGDGNPFVTYYKGSSQDLLGIHCHNVACSSSTPTVIAETGDVGRYSSVAIDPSGIPIIAFYDDTNGALNLARCADVTCSSATIDVVDDSVTADVGLAVSLAIGSDGNPVMSYGVDDEPENPTNNVDLRVAHCPDVFLDDGGEPWSYDCHDDATPTTKTNIADGDAPIPSSGIVIGSDGLPFVTDFFGAFHCTSADCAPHCPSPFGDGAICELQQGFKAVGATWGGNSSPTVGSDGLIALLASDPQLGPVVAPMAHCTDLACSGMTKVGVVGLGPSSSLTSGADGLPLISNQLGSEVPGEPTVGLQVIHCPNALCVPNQRRR